MPFRWIPVQITHFRNVNIHLAFILWVVFVLGWINDGNWHPFNAGDLIFFFCQRKRNSNVNKHEVGRARKVCARFLAPLIRQTLWLCNSSVTCVDYPWRPNSSNCFNSLHSATCQLYILHTHAEINYRICDKRDVKCITGDFFKCQTFQTKTHAH